LVPRGSLVPGPGLPELAPGERRELLDRVHRVGPAALRAHRSYLPISHGIIVLSPPPGGKRSEGA